MPLVNYASLLEHAIIGGVLTTIFLISNYSLHRIEEGHVGIYFRVSLYFYFYNSQFIIIKLNLGWCFIA